MPTSVDFVIPAAGGHVTIFGLYTLDIPANAVCDPSAPGARDLYAAGAWDAPCTTATTDIKVHATLQWSHNRLWADFSPSLRFDPNQVVTISTNLMAPIVRYYADGDNRDISNGRSRKWGIFFASAINGKPVDDSRADGSLRTTINFATGKISRRIKHFTGYNIATGETCIVSPEDIFCVEGTPEPRP